MLTTACQIEFRVGPSCPNDADSCPDPAFSTYIRQSAAAAASVLCSARLVMRGPAVRVHVYGCPGDGSEATARASEQEGLLRGMLLPPDSEDAECAAAIPGAAPCMEDLDPDSPGTRVLSYWRMKARTPHPSTFTKRVAGRDNVADPS